MRKILLSIFVLPLAFVFITPMLARTPFEYMDRNNDDKLSRSEFRGPPRAFKRIDSNADGYITRQEAAGTRLLGNPGKKAQSEPNSAQKAATDLIYVDTHNHLVGRRVAGRYNLEKPARIAMQNMDATGVKLNILMPMPQAANQGMHLYVEDLLPIAKNYPPRFAVLGGGGTLNVMIQQAVDKGRVTQKMQAEFDARAMELVQKGVVGFGEMTAEHFSMDANHPYEWAPPDHPLFLRLADLAAKYDLPIDMHMEAIPEEMPMPNRFQSPPNPSLLKPNMAAFNRLLAHNRKAKFIWAHLGWCSTGKRTIGLTRKILAENTNLFMSIRIASGMQKRKVVKSTFPLDRNGELQQDWLALFQEFPDRFVIGSDEIIKPADDHPSAGSIRSTVAILEQLPMALRSKIGYANAHRIYKLSN